MTKEKYLENKRYWKNALYSFKYIDFDIDKFAAAHKALCDEYYCLISEFYTEHFEYISQELSQDVRTILSYCRTKNRYYFYQAISDRNKIGFLSESSYKKMIAFKALGGDVDEYLKSKGQMTSLEKILKHNFRCIKESTIQKVSDRLKPASVTVKFTDNFVWAYDSHNHQSNRGSLEKSCMNDLDYVNFYSNYPCKVAYIENPDNEKIIARALFWEVEDKKFLDRVYAIDDVTSNAFYNWTHAKGIENYRDTKSLNRTLKTIPPKEKFDSDCDTPYVDTFYMYDNRTQELSSCNGDIELRETNGNALRGLCCCNCGECCDEDDGYYNEDSDFYCSDCYHERYTHCENCSDEIRTDNAYYNDTGESFCEDCYSNKYTRCSCCEAEIELEDGHEVDDENYCENCVSKCDGCKEYKLDKDMSKNENGDYLCPDCMTEYEEQKEKENEETNTSVE